MITHTREMADKVTSEKPDDGWERIYTYKKWLLEHVFVQGVLVLPIEEEKPNYRDDPPP